MIRRATYIIVSLILFISTSGFTISKHYCGSQLIDIRIDAQAHSCCDGPGLCKACHDELTYIKIKDDFLGSFSFENLQLPEFDLHLPLISVDLFKSLENTFYSIFNNWESPPPRGLHNILSLLQSYLN